MRIAVIGGGWYGCHMALNLKKLGVSVQIYEKEDDIFQRASGYNQNRLHMGYHYPRSFITRKQSLLGYKQFLATYGDLVQDIKYNIYAVAWRQSYIDFETYLQVLKGSDLSFEKVSPPEFGLQNMDGAIICEEKLILTDKARELFRSEFASELFLSKAVHTIESNPTGVTVNGEHFDLVLNCTWCTFDYKLITKIFYEPSVTLLYNSNVKDRAITIMDGDFFSLYPHNESDFSLTTVADTPRGRYFNFSEAKRHISFIDDGYIHHVRKNMEKITKDFYPTFDDDFEYYDFFTSIKTKIADNSDSREFIIEEHDRVITVLSGKIDAIFGAWREVAKIISKYDGSFAKVSAEM